MSMAVLGTNFTSHDIAPRSAIAPHHHHHHHHHRREATRSDSLTTLNFEYWGGVLHAACRTSALRFLTSSTKEAFDQRLHVGMLHLACCALLNFEYWRGFWAAATSSDDWQKLINPVCGHICPYVRTYMRTYTCACACVLVCLGSSLAFRFFLFLSLVLSFSLVFLLSLSLSPSLLVPYFLLFVSSIFLLLPSPLPLCVGCLCAVLFCFIIHSLLYFRFVTWESPYGPTRVPCLVYFVSCVPLCLSRLGCIG